MKDPIQLILRLLGYEYNKKRSLIRMHMLDVTHETWMQQLYRQGRINEYTL